MNYELAKKLKDAGFPQYDVEERQIEGCYIPSLSELIEACGDDFDELNRIDIDNWTCGHHHCWEGDFDFYEESSGSSPEEAVANLWLKLQDKNKII